LFKRHTINRFGQASHRTTLKHPHVVIVFNAGSQHIAEYRFSRRGHEKVQMSEDDVL